MSPEIDCPKISTRALKRGQQRLRKKMGQQQRLREKMGHMDADLRPDCPNTLVSLEGTSESITSSLANVPNSAAHEDVLIRFGDTSVQGVKLITKNTFFDEEIIEPAPSNVTDEDLRLPPAVFGSNPDFEEWRYAYRKFRLGFHRGAKGEAFPPRTCDSDCDLCSTSTCSTLDLLPDSSGEQTPPSAPSEASEDDRLQLTTSRAAKRFRQREKRRTAKSEARAVLETAPCEFENTPALLRQGCRDDSIELMQGTPFGYIRVVDWHDAQYEEWESQLRS